VTHIWAHVRTGSLGDAHDVMANRLHSDEEHAANDKRIVERRRLVAALLGPSASELGCEECFEQLDRFVDLTLTDGDADRGVPGMRAHLLGCPACRDDYESLLAYAAMDEPLATCRRVGG
jgi:hypothetical protein